MPRGKRFSEEVINKLRQAEVLLGQGKSVDELNLSAREFQVYEWILRETPTAEALDGVLKSIKGNIKNMQEEKESDPELNVLHVTRELLKKSGSRKVLFTEISREATKQSGANITPTRVGKVLRSFGVAVTRSSGGMIVTITLVALEKLMKESGFFF